MSSYVFLCLLMCSYVFLCLLMSSFDFLCLLLSSFVLLCPLLSSFVFFCLLLSSFVFFFFSWSSVLMSFSSYCKSCRSSCFNLFTWREDYDSSRVRKNIYIIHKEYSMHLHTMNIDWKYCSKITPKVGNILITAGPLRLSHQGLSLVAIP